MKINNDSIISSPRPKLDAETLEALGINIPSKPPKGYYSIEELMKALGVCYRAVQKKLKKYKKQNKLDVVVVYTKNRSDIMCYKKFYRIKK